MERYDDAWVRKMAAEEARKGGGLVSSRFADCKDVLDVLEVLDEILWVLPKAERASAPPPPEPKPTATPAPSESSSRLSAKQLRQAISLGSQMASNEAQLMLAMKARQLAERDRRRPRLVYDLDRIEPRQA
jgi:hypothetical protein